MVFSSIIFLFYFFPAFLLCYYLLPWKNAVLLVGSLLFYAWGEPKYVPLLLGSACLNYGFGYAISAAGPRRKLLLQAGIAINLLVLFRYKYLAFALGSAAAALGIDLQGKLPDAALPLGISFFTFQGISYLIDVYRGDVKAQKSIVDFAMYKAMFPQLIAGPIVRYSDVANEIRDRQTSSGAIWAGFRQFVFGLGQKVLIANTVALAADRVFALDPAQLTATHAWMGLAAYSIQIFFDFCGYSNMAIGMGHMLGFKYPPNFNWPYTARSVTDFWRRWHMSLSSWFRDYLYIPLGGNRGSPARTYFNLSVVFLLCGLWHGAAWTFIVWGGWHGLLLIIERAGLERRLRSLPRLLAQLYTLLAVMIGWVFFRASDLPYAFKYIGALFGAYGGSAAKLPWNANFDFTALTALAIGIALAVWPREGANTTRQAAPDRNWIASSVAAKDLGWIIPLLMLSVASLAAGTYNPFIYFRF